MPNTLVHLCVQKPASRILIRDADFKWIALGCIIPDIPWVLQRIILIALPGVNLIDLRIYVVIQASLFFCLFFCLALSLLSTSPGRIFLLLSLNSFLHLLLDALQTKWANGVHFFAPISWQVTNFSFFWPESRVTLILTLLGLGVMIIYGAKDWKKRVWITTKQKNWMAAALLIVAYFLFPFLMFHGPEKENNHYVATLRNTEERPGKYIEFDRVRFRSRDKTIYVFSGEKLYLHGNIPQKDALLSLQGNFSGKKNIQVATFHVHSPLRDIASMIGLTGVMFIWLLAIGRKNITLDAPSRIIQGKD